MSTLDVLDVDFASSQGRDLLEAISRRHGAAITRVAERLSRGLLFRSAWAPGLCVVGAQADIRHEAGAATKTEKFSFGGCGLSLEDAAVSCLGEAAERISQVERANDIARAATLAEAGADVRPQISALARRLLGASSRGDDVALDWLAGRDLAGREVLVPADWCIRRAAAGPLKIPGAALSVGCAAGPTPEAACSRALLEAVERDAVSLWWQGGRRGAALQIDAPAMEGAARLLDRLRGGHGSRRTSLLDVTTDLGIPVVVAFSTDPAGENFVAGYGARTSLADAAAAALIELCQMELGLQLASLKRDQLGANALAPGDLAHLTRATGIHVATDPRFQAGRRDALPGSDAQDGNGIRLALERHGIDTILVDLTRNDIGIAVVKAVAPALQLLPSAVETDRLRASMAAHAGALPRDAIELT